MWSKVRPSSVRRQQKGVVALIVALMLLPLLVICGLAIDALRVYAARQSLQQALDSATLAAGADNANMSLANVTTIAQAYLSANAAWSNVTITGQNVTSNTDTRIVDIVLSGRVNTTFMRLLKINTVNLSVSSRAQRSEPGPLDLVLALDTTASMNLFPTGGTEKKITTLIDAATALAEQVMIGNNIEIGIVPYSTYINVSRISPTPSWVLPRSRTTTACITREFTGNDCKRTKIDCVVDGIWTINGCTEVDCGRCIETKTTVNEWTGCIGPRTIDGSASGTDRFLDTISAPTLPPYPGMPGDYVICSLISEILPLTNDRTKVLKQIKQMKVSGETYIPGGLTWAWNLLDPGIPYTARTKAQLDAIGGKKAMVLMTDGINSTSPRLIDAALLPNGNTSIPAAWRNGTKSLELISTLCTRIKASGIELYTVLFDVKDLPTETLLTNCATAPSYAYKASDKDGLLRAFAEIGNRLRRLRLLD